MKLTLEQIQLTTDDLADVAARHVSSQEIYSPTAPKAPSAQFGWRDRWWLNQTAAAAVAIHYWFFESDTEACTAADEGRFRLSAQTVPKPGGRGFCLSTASEQQTRSRRHSMASGCEFSIRPRYRCYTGSRNRREGLSGHNPPDCPKNLFKDSLS